MWRKYTDEQFEWLTANIQGRPFRELTDMFNARYGTNCTIDSLRTVTWNHGLKNGIDCRFNK